MIITKEDLKIFWTKKLLVSAEKIVPTVTNIFFGGAGEVCRIEMFGTNLLIVDSKNGETL